MVHENPFPAIHGFACIISDENVTAAVQSICLSDGY